MNGVPEEMRERIGPALGKLPSGIFVSTAQGLNGRRIGMLASFVEQAAFQPPAVMMAVGRDRPLLQALTDGNGHFGINILAKENGPLLAAFGKPKEGDPFEGFALVENPYRIPQLADAMAFLACRVTGKLEAGDHVVVVGEVLDAVLQKPELQPMVRIRPNGFGY